MRRYCGLLLTLAMLSACSTSAVAPIPSAVLELTTATITPRPLPTLPMVPSPTLEPSPTALPTPTAVPELVIPEDRAALLDGPLVEAEIFRLINELRAQNGLPALQRNPQIDEVSRAHSCDIAARGAISHESSDGRKLAQRLAGSEPPWVYVSENIAVGYNDPAMVVTMWFDEQPPDDWHRRNILAENVTDLGVGYCHNPSDPSNMYHYWTADFAGRNP